MKIRIVSIWRIENDNMKIRCSQMSSINTNLDSQIVRFQELEWDLLLSLLNLIFAKFAHSYLDHINFLTQT